MFYIKESGGKYYLADPKWSRAYEEGMLFEREPAACFSSEADARLFLVVKTETAPDASTVQNSLTEHPGPPRENAAQCPADCKFRFGHMNEEKCDYCVRKGNIHDFYEAEVRRDWG